MLRIGLTEKVTLKQNFEGDRDIATWIAKARVPQALLEMMDPGRVIVKCLMQHLAFNKHSKMKITTAAAVVVRVKPWKSGTEER